MYINNIVNNKNIVLVGNSKSTLGLGDFIDSYEFVIRFNKAISFLNSNKYNIGSKFDAWVYAMVDEKYCRLLYDKARIKPRYCVRYSNKDVYHLKFGNSSQIDREFVLPKVSKELSLSSGQQPSTGVSMLYYLVEYCDFKSITLVGFDSFKNCNFYENRKWAGLWHDGEKEAGYIDKLEKQKIITVI